MSTIQGEQDEIAAAMRLRLAQAKSQDEIWTIYLDTQDHHIEDLALLKFLEKSNPQEQQMVWNAVLSELHKETWKELHEMT